MFGNGTGGTAGFGTGKGGAGGLDGLGGKAMAPFFFGTKIEGRRVVFVLDNSGSMQGGRLETVIAELLKCVDSLDPKKQEFYVVFYSDVPYPLFYPTPANNFVKPTDRNKQMLAAWLGTVELCMGDAVVEALNAAMSIQPDTVILLSDGRVQGEKKMAALLNANQGVAPIHTVGIGLGAGKTARENLQQIAEANGGEFREAEVPDEMKQLARKEPRPYHDAAPGRVWGRAVKPRRTR
jgi:Ca-activated chloride channel family protein